MKQIFIYRTHPIISCGLYIFLPNFSLQFIYQIWLKDYNICYWKSKLHDFSRFAILLFNNKNIKVPFEPAHFTAKINLFWYLQCWNSTTNTASIIDKKKKSCNSKAKSRKWQLICYWQTLFLPSKSFWKKNCNTQILIACPCGF